MTDEAEDVVRSAIDGAVQGGADLGDVARAILEGILRDRGPAAQQAFEDAARAILEQTKKAGGDVAAASRGILEAALRNARKLNPRAA